MASIERQICTTIAARFICQEVAEFDADGKIMLKFDALEPDATETLVESSSSSLVKVGRCKLDPSLKATCFQPLNLRVHTVLST